ncbi:hypothetical protein GQ607_003351 [Colletotrichum asianum]|uniref:Fungal N-terminal domain-containing protein n=1 Tax=Colletotrichum asianum TaxID=702518 RepID=A0A8H3WRN6_9PEZI|nr:hypothetical protein GQ607_003351 [Colletotrichum asianum]
MAEALGVTASLIAILELSTKTIAYILAARNAAREKADLASEIRACQILISGIIGVVDSDHWTTTLEVLSQPGGPLAALEAIFIEILEKIDSRDGWRRGLRALKWPFDEKHIKNLLVKIGGHKESLCLALSGETRLVLSKLAH